MFSFAIRLIFRLFKAALAITLILVVAWFFREPLLNTAARVWVVDDTITHADAVVVLGGGRDWRPYAAAELHKAGKAPLVLVSQPKREPSQVTLSLASDADHNRAILISLGVPPDKIAFFGTDVTSTHQEATALREWALAHSDSIKTIAIPTDAFHTRRAKWVFRRELEKSSVQVLTCTAKNPNYTVENWWHSEQGFLCFQNEVLKSLYYYVNY